MTNDYLDNQISKCLKNIQFQMRNEKINWDKVRICLYKLVKDAFKEGVYVGN